MTTALQPFTIQPITYEETVERLTEIADGCLALTVSGLDDKTGLEEVHKSRMQLVKLRGNIERQRKAMKAAALEYGKQVDGAAKELQAIIAPAEEHLEREESIVAREKERLRQEEAARRQAKIKAKLEAFAAVGVVMTTYELEAMPEEQCVAAYLEAKLAHEEKQRRAAAEAAEMERLAEQQRIEAERLAQEKAELERQRLEQAQLQAKIDAEAKRIEAEKAAVARAAELELAKAEAAEQARRDAELQRLREEAEAKAAAEAEAAEQKRIEALRPDSEKLAAVADAVMEIEVPPVSKAAGAAAETVRQLLADAASGIREAAGTLTKKGRKKV